MSQLRKYALPADLRARARELRGDLTDAEQRLWYFLRRRQIAGLRFRRQHPIAGFIADFYCHEARLAVELDGGQHLESEYDARRTRAIESLGVRVLRFWNHDVLGNTEAVLEEIARIASGEGE